MKNILGSFLVAAVLTAGIGAAAFAQDTAQKPPAATQEKEIDPLTKAQLDILVLQQQLALATGELTMCKAQLAPEQYKANTEALTKAMQEKVAEFEKANPGWTIDLNTMKPVKKTEKK